MPTNPLIKTDSTVIDETKQYSLNSLEQGKEIPTYKYSIRFIDNNTYEELKPEISEETIYETVLVDDYQIEGYEVLSDSYDDIDKEGIYFYIDTEKETNAFVVLYEKIADSGSGQITNNESYTPIDTDASSGDTNNQSADVSVEDSNIKSDASNEDESQSADSSLQPPDNSDDINATSGTNIVANTVASLLTTVFTDEGITENIPSSDDINSGTEEFTE